MLTLGLASSIQLTLHAHMAGVLRQISHRARSGALCIVRAFFAPLQSCGGLHIFEQNWALATVSCNQSHRPKAIQPSCGEKTSRFFQLSCTSTLSTADLRAPKLSPWSYASRCFLRGLHGEMKAPHWHVSIRPGSLPTNLALVRHTIVGT